MSLVNRSTQALLRGFKLGAIIGTLVVLAACNATRLAYNNAPQLAWWWLDGYIDFSREHAPRAKDALAQLLSWHRQTQLNDYAVFVATVGKQMAEPVTAAQVCTWFAQARVLAQPSVEQAATVALDLLPTLGAAQLAHLEQRLAKANADYRKERMSDDPDERVKQRVKRGVDSTERIYGSVEEPQRRILEAAAKASVFNAPAQLAEREQRQKAIVQVLRSWLAQPPERAAAKASIAQWVEHAEHSPDPIYRVVQQRQSEMNCRLNAEVHNSTSPAQRVAARKQFKEWEDDLRALALAK